MKILIIGNGFDKAHGLPTGYKDFIGYIEEFIGYFVDGDDYECSEGMVKLSRTMDLLGYKPEFISLIQNNAWIEYFIERQSFLGDKWIDCEEEIKVIIALFELRYKGPEDIEKINIDNWSADHFRKVFNNICMRLNAQNENEQVANKYSSIPIEEMFIHLRSFTRAFEIYCLCINQATNEYATKHNLKDAAIKQHISKQANTNTIITDANSILTTTIYDCILSFNYTRTYENMYGLDENNKQKLDSTRYCYIHGIAQSDAKEINMVLGIDDTLYGNESRSFFSYAKFKKYFQRILFKTGSEYRDWINSIEQRAPNNLFNVHDVHIIGHSIGSTDHEVLKEFFDVWCHNNKVRITVFYHDAESEIRVIENTIRMLGRDEVIQRVRGRDWTIRFANQYDKNVGIMKHHEELEHQIW